MGVCHTSEMVVSCECAEDYHDTNVRKRSKKRAKMHVVAQTNTIEPTPTPPPPPPPPSLSSPSSSNAIEKQENVRNERKKEDNTDEFTELREETLETLSKQPKYINFNKITFYQNKMENYISNLTNSAISSSMYLDQHCEHPMHIVIVLSNSQYSEWNKYNGLRDDIVTEFFSEGICVNFVNKMIWKPILMNRGYIVKSFCLFEYNFDGPMSFDLNFNLNCQTIVEWIKQRSSLTYDIINNNCMDYAMYLATKCNINPNVLLGKSILSMNALLKLRDMCRIAARAMVADALETQCSGGATKPKQEINESSHQDKEKFEKNLKLFEKLVSQQSLKRQVIFEKECDSSGMDSSSSDDEFDRFDDDIDGGYPMKMKIFNKRSVATSKIRIESYDDLLNFGLDLKIAAMKQNKEWYNHVLRAT